MIRSIYLSFGLCFLLNGAGSVMAQTPPTDAAIREAVRRQADTIQLQQKLEAARVAEQRGDLPVSAKLYEESLKLVEAIGPNGIEAESVGVISGLTNVRMKLAKEAEARHDLPEADVQVSRVIKVNPKDEAAIAFKAKLDKQLAEMVGMMPDEATLARLPDLTKERVANATKVQNAKLLFENGKYKEAEAILRQVLTDEPGNYAATYYSSLIKEQLYASAQLRREIATKGNLLEVGEAWDAVIDRSTLPVPNPYAHTNLIHTSKRRQELALKLERIHIDNVFYDGLPLSEVIRNLATDVKRRDPDKQGINFLVAPNADGAGSRGGAGAGVMMIDPNTGLPVQQGFQEEEEPLDLGSISIKINPALSDVRLQDLLDILVMVAERPIKYSIEDYGVVFSLKSREQADPLHTRTFRVDPNTFWMGLENVSLSGFGDIQTSSGGGGGGGGGGGRGGSGGGNNSGGGGQNGGNGGSGVSVPRVSVAAGGNNNGGGNQGGGGQFGGAQGAGGGAAGRGGGLAGITERSDVAFIQAAVRDFFGSLGVDLSPPKTVFFNDRQGTLIVRANLRDLDIIESAIQVLNIVPPQVNIRAKFAEVSQNDTKALGFDWYLGNTLVANDKIGISAGTAPSYLGAPSTANPLGFFPGTSTANTIPSSASDQLLTSGNRNAANAPALATITGILTDPQFRLVIRAMEQRQGIELLSAPDVTTVSGRQAQIQVTDIQTIVTGNDLDQTSSGGGGDTVGGGGGGGAVGSTSQYETQALPFGPVLDVIPYVSADGFTVQMALIPTITEFIGYDDPGQFVNQAQSVSSGAGSGGASVPVTAQLPLPRFRVRQVTTTTIVWDGQTIALGGLLAESITKTKDKVPVLGDLPFLGKFFRSESNVALKKNLVIFVTPTILDPAGNRMNSDADMPFRGTAIPAQRPPIEGAAAR